MTKLKIIEGAAPEGAAEPTLSSARARLASAIALRPGMAAEVAEIERQQRKLSSLVIAERQAADTVASLEAAAVERALLWARSNGQDPPALSNGGDLLGAKEVLVEAQLAAAAARAASPELQAEMSRALDRRRQLEDSVKAHALDVLGELASEIASRIAEHERAIGAECARLAAMRRPLMRLVGLQGATKAISAINATIEARRFAESEVPALERRYQAFADALIADASATLEGA
jgi:hypothetical protein